MQESPDKLPCAFIQTNKSYIVKSEKIESFDKNILNMGKTKNPISESFTDRVLRSLE
ncbi:MAG: LytTR family transcriptional regulator DNA-binding domain-containing protein [Bacteroidales bacterium]|nr:LytTR family transcriptional regulator DNA-binding domain-containing protein [Bacteroidales bacterium]